ncbi:unnamed protein product [Meganyctiphanes norvegica]|uniref:Uncharacterized protein n=1 Tax=Meganyctiphanes norvegica TaxID=48144 RepID=A0AAV2RDL4_MEGNR
MFSTSGQLSQSELVSTIAKLKILINEDDEHCKNCNNPLIDHEFLEIKNSMEISTILLWIATNHPEVLRDDADELENVSVKRLDFRSSWEFPDKLIPTDALIILLKSRVCKDIRTYCGNVNPQVLKNFPEKMHSLRLALGKYSDAGSLIEALICRLNQIEQEYAGFSEDIIIHIRCRELGLEELTKLSIVLPKVYISDVTDNDAEWVVQAVSALKSIEDYSEDIDTLYLPLSKVTATGVEAIAKGLFDAGISLDFFNISSPYLGDDVSDSDDDSESDDDSDW